MEPKEAGFSVHARNKFYSFSREVLETEMSPMRTHTAGLAELKGEGWGPSASDSARNWDAASYPVSPLEGASNLNSPGPSLPLSRPWLPFNQSSNIYPKRSSKGM